MCESERILGQFHSNFPSKELALAARDVFLEEVCDLVRAKTGCDASPRLTEHGFVFDISSDRAFGVLPGWCRRAIDRADPRKLIARVSITERDDSHVDYTGTLAQHS